MRPEVKDALEATTVTSMDGTSPIHHSLNREHEYKSPHLTIRIQRPENWESLLCRLTRHEPALGCIDVEGLIERRVDSRDMADVQVFIDEGESPKSMALACFLAHLVHPDSLYPWSSTSDDEDGNREGDEEAGNDNHKDGNKVDGAGERSNSSDDGPPADKEAGGHHQAAAELAELYRDGTWAGTLVWDSAILLSEFLCQDAGWRQRVAGSRVVELGCGLGVPGFVTRILGAEAVALTDRGMVADLCAENIELNPWVSAPAGPGMFSMALEWTEDGAAELMERLGGPPDLVLVADCIFVPLYGESNPLMDVLSQLVPAEARDASILIAAERRPGDGVDLFVANAEPDFTTRLLLRQGNILILEMQRSSGP